MYDRSHEQGELTFEPSGALQRASLVMRDRETDSWWSIMSSSAIGGALEGADLQELPVGEKTTWADWSKRYPQTRVLSVGGREHVENNPYDNYLASDGTFRGIEVADDRLGPKEPVYTFWHGGRPHAIAHRDFQGGGLFDLGDGGPDLLVHRPENASLFASTRAWLLPDGLAASTTVADLVSRIEAGDLQEVERMTGFDTFWYNWIAVNPDSALLTE